MVFLGRLWTDRTDRDRNKSLPTAKEWYLRSLELKRTAPLLTLLGAVCTKLDQITEAKAAFDEAIALDPRYDEAMYNLAVLERKAAPKRCIELLRAAVEIDPEYALAHQMLGRVLQRQGNRTAAEQHFRRCIEIDPDDYWSNLFLANLLGVLKRNEEAEQAYRHAVEIEPELSCGFKFFANFLDSIGKREEATIIRSQATLVSSGN
jgi:tetratricopeptide (TPR) repeat protein